VVHHHLGERHQGHGQPLDVPVTRRAEATVVLVATAVLVAGCGTVGDAPDPGAAAERPDGRLVLVSGRDDHGERRFESVSVYESPDAKQVAGSIPDGTFAHVREIDGQMLEVVTAEGNPVTGWVDDFHLRGTVHLVGPAPDCRARLGGTVREAGLQVVVMGFRGGQVLLQSVSDPAARGWAARELVQELPPQGSDCSGEPDTAGHTH
jgi:hypothetical protein